MRLWIDDVREPPGSGWVWTKTVKDAKSAVMFYEHQMSDDMLVLSLDHDAGDYCGEGGDYIKLLDWLEENELPDLGYIFHLHTMNPVGRDNMRRVIKRNGWKEVYSV